MKRFKYAIVSAVFMLIGLSCAIFMLFGEITTSLLAITFIAEIISAAFIIKFLAVERDSMLKKNSDLEKEIIDKM